MRLFYASKITFIFLTALLGLLMSQAVPAQSFLDQFSTTQLAISTGNRTKVLSIDKANDGNLYIAGNFRSVVGGSTVSVGIARLNALGEVDPSFSPSITVGTEAHKVIGLPDGKVLVAGRFTRINSTPTGSVVRLNNDGSLDTSFTTHSTGVAYDLALQEDGKIIVAGDFPVVPGFTPGPTRLYRLNADGTLDTSFKQSQGGNGNGVIKKVIVLKSKKILIAGQFTEISTTPRSHIALLNEDGSLNTGSFANIQVNNNIEALAVQKDGKVVIGGAFTDINGVNRSRVARLNADGSLDTSFVPSANIDSYVVSLSIARDGKILMGGNFNTLGGSFNNTRIGRLNTDGTTDSTFTARANGIVWDTYPSSDGSIFVGGRFSSISALASQGISRLSELGKVDNNFKAHPATNGRVNSVAVVPYRDTVWLGGTFTQVGQKQNKLLSRQDSHGNNIPSFSTPITSSGVNVNSIAATLDGSLIAAGQISSATNSTVTKVTSTGALHPSFTSASADNPVLAITNQPDGRILVGGIFGLMNSTGRNRIARLLPDGTADPSFVPPSSLSGTVRGIIVQEDGKIVAAGRLFLGSRRAAVVRFNEDGSEDTTFNSGGVTPGTDVYTIARQADGKYLIGGNFTGVNGNPKARIARLNADGSLDQSFSPPFPITFNVLSISTRSDGSIVIGGRFANGSYKNIAILNEDGSLDTRFTFPNATSDAVRAIAEQSHGKTIIGGEFTSTSGQGGNNRKYFTRFGTEFSEEEISLSISPDGKDLTVNQAGFSPVYNWAFLESSTDGQNWVRTGEVTRENKELVFKNINLGEEELRYFRITANGGGAPSSGSLYQHTYQVYRSKDPDDGCDFYIIRTSTGSGAAVCI